MRLLIFCALAAVSCMSTSKTDVITLGVESENIVTGYGDTMRLGGYGSSIAYDAKEELFYLLTDRGPNTDYGDNEAKMFPMPNYSPTVGVFRRSGDSLKLVRKVILKDANGNPMLGIPNVKGDGVTGEIAYNPKGEKITGEYMGIDSEGLALSPDGTLWVSDEYGPFVMNFSMEGKLLKILSPSNGLPKYFAKRRPNRGMEGLTISADGKKLYGIMQSPLYLPDNSTRNKSVNNRIIEISLENGKTREFIYQLEKPKRIVSEITYIDNSTMLVLERDGKFPKDGKGFKRVYEITIDKATDVSGKEIELLSSAELGEQGIVPVTKELYIDILKAIPTYPHDKAEGIVFIDKEHLAIVNDDDFTVVDENNTFKPKLNAAGKEDHSTVYIIKVKK